MLRKKEIKIKNFFIYLKKYQIFFGLKKRIAVFSMMILPIGSVSAGMTIYIDNTVYEYQKPIVANDTVINLDENIIINFAVPIADTQEYEKNITVYPQTQLMYFWGNEGGRLTIVPKSIWDPDTKYSVFFPHHSEKNDPIATVFSFETVSYPKIIETNIDSDKYIAEGQDIVVKFDSLIDDFDVHAVSRPAIETTQFYDKESKQLHITLGENAKSRSGFHTLTIFAKHKKQDRANYYPLTAVSFNAFLPQPELWPKEHQERVEIAKKSTAPKILDGKYIDVNLQAQITTLFEDGEFVANFVSSTGAKDTPTPTGTFEIYNKDPYALSNMFQVYLPYWMAFTEDGKYGFHDLIVWPEGHEDMPSGGKESERSIGNAVSPGCVRHDAQNSKFIYDWADIGTPVVIY